MALLGTKKKDGDLGLGTADELWGGVSGLLEEGPKGKKRKRKKVKPVPPLSYLTQVRRVEGGAVEDFAGVRYTVWAVEGCDSANMAVMNGWLLMLNSIEYPIQILVRQHAPDFSAVRSKLLEIRPEHMRTGKINDVGNSMVDYLTELEDGGRVVSREWYVVAHESRSMELASIMNQCGFEISRLDDDELGLLLQGCVSGMGFGHEQDMYQAIESKNEVELNYRYMSVYDVHKWPRRISTLFLEQLMRMGEEMDVSIWVWPVSQRESHSMLQMQRSRFEGARISAEQKGKLVPPAVELAIDDATRIADEIERGVSRLFRRTMTVAVYGRDREALREVGEKVSGHFRSALSGLRLLKLRQGRGMASMMPALRRGGGEMNLTDSGTMQRMFPFGPQDLDKRDGTLMAMDLRSRTPVMYNPFDPSAMNAHMVVLARSGGGKSFFTKLQVVRESQRGIPTYLIDPEGEYGVITRALGGEVFVPGSPGYGLNPFLIGYSDEGDLAKRISSLGSLVAVMLEGQVDQTLKASIDACLMGFYRKELIERGGGLLARGGMSAFHEYLISDDAKNKGGDQLAFLLARFATGSAQFLMRGDARNLLENEKPVTSFNLKNLAGPLKPVATAICAEVVWGLAVTSPRPRRLVVDECWTVLATPSGAESLITIVKRARKYQLGLLTITQDVQDFLAESQGLGAIVGHAGRSLLQNSATKLALSQDPAALPLVAEALGLSPEVEQFLGGVLRGQGVLVGERGDVYPVEIVSTMLEREMVTDDSWRQDGDGGLDDMEVDEKVRQLELADMLAVNVEREQGDRVMVSG